MELNVVNIYPLLRLFIATLLFPLCGGTKDGWVSIGVALVGPETHVALDAPLTFAYRFDPLNQTDFVGRVEISIQLNVIQEESGTLELVGTKAVFPATIWNQVIFDCGLIVRGGIYDIRLINPKSVMTQTNDPYFYIRTYNDQLVDESENRVHLEVIYPTITFDVPSHLEAYTPNVVIAFGLTRSLCPPIKSLPPTVLLLTRTVSDDEVDGYRGHHSTVLVDDPLAKLEVEGRVSVTVKCQLWSRNASYIVEIRENFGKKKLIAKSWTIKVNWSWKFGLSIGKSSIVPCRRNVRLTLSYPQCILHGKDKVRVYGYQSLPVPSFLAPRRQSYITEKQILTNGSDDGKTMFFPCSLFPQRFTKYCFQYVNIAEDESVAVVMEECIPTFLPQKFVDGGWSNWSDWSECSTSCGQQGKRLRFRFCDSPHPSFGGNYCQGPSIEEDVCEDEEHSPLPSCPTQLQNTTTVSMIPPEIDSPEVEYPLRHQAKGGQLWKDESNHFGEPKNKRIPTSGCECGCILQDLVPGFNYTLVISLTSNHSVCEDLDEEDHHNLRWILHTRGARDRIRFQVLAAAGRCVVLTFRDGNTSDSNLLQLITTPTFARMNETQTIESTGTSLSIGAADVDDLTSNCTLPSMYFFGYYHILPPPPPDLGDQFLSWKDFWTFLLLKLSVLIFLIVSVVSLISGCAKKVYDYKELKWTRTDLDEEGSLNYRNSSRATSVTLIPFDTSYLRRLRLKHFLLRPRKVTAPHVTSLPNTPGPKYPRRFHKLRLQKLLADERRLVKSISLSDSNLERHRCRHDANSSTQQTTGTSVVIVETTFPSTSEDLTPRVDSTSYDVGSEDLEMDYYDYDIQNAGNIPGSYLLEPFLFWTDPIEGSVSDNCDQGIELMNTSGTMTNSSFGLFTPEPNPDRDSCIQETSFDTLDGYRIKFADDEEDDDETRTISEGVVV